MTDIAVIYLAIGISLTVLINLTSLHHYGRHLNINEAVVNTALWPLFLMAVILKRIRS